jgi:hypothetical protein
MTKVPAFCDNCGAIFPSGFDLSGQNITLFGNKSGPCPRCGSMGHIPDGVYNVINNTIEILSAPEWTIDELNRFAQILREAQRQAATQEEIDNRIKNEIPGLSGLAKLLPKNRSELYAFLTLILTVIQLRTTQPNNQPTFNITVNQVIQQVYLQAPTSEELTQHSLKRIEKPGMNDHCPCGSGKKYKKCCGAPN